MADRFFHVDVQFAHKATCKALLERFGPAGPLVFLLALAEAKKNNPPGTFTYENEALGWSRLGLTGHQPDFTLEEFFTYTGHRKQTRKTRSTHVQDVAFTQYGRWQKDWQRQEERDRKARSRAHSKRDKTVTPPGTANGQERDRELDLELTPLPPYGTEGQTPEPDPKSEPEENVRRVQELASAIGLPIAGDRPDS